MHVQSTTPVLLNPYFWSICQLHSIGRVGYIHPPQETTKQRFLKFRIVVKVFRFWGFFSNLVWSSI